ncbi:uncharacterized protein N7458_000661 [Penicillium daleae]|uniref:Uncharacterized protein n=1 Tax=Penicillium daleae TaxID=63821 RepID=A0AAD6CGE0_9EURO|nr:uncharacterized protein N7458_000661 [Penicillium daleae]KAJ5464975.1 hypothetical protein N7458_000661 [Penicillium daleae]
MPFYDIQHGVSFTNELRDGIAPAIGEGPIYQDLYDDDSLRPRSIHRLQDALKLSEAYGY